MKLSRSGYKHAKSTALDGVGTVVVHGARESRDLPSHRFAGYVGGTSRERWSRGLLRHAMEQQGFTVYAQEWWHFDNENWRDYAIGNATF